ncbi:unnamed protein product [Arabis nemorensis]|uniref:Uncharacterized protein n=1 Tax=Arabis nemorensis TaxID=586526 RepID=A0A565BNB4_9BRAS|nr:unnamed protein product [Arabis nemorensis]
MVDTTTENLQNVSVPNCLSVPYVYDGYTTISADPLRIELADVIKKVLVIKNSRPKFESHEIEANDMSILVDNLLAKRPAKSADMRSGVSKMSHSSSWTGPNSIFGDNSTIMEDGVRLDPIQDVVNP